MKKMLTVIMTFILVLSLCGCSQAQADWQTQFDLGQKYLSELSYDEAMLAFTKAIEIDPKQPGAYIQLASVYIQLGDTDSAQQIMDLAVKNIGTDNAEINNALREFGFGAQQGGDARQEQQEQQEKPVVEGDMSLAGQTVRTDSIRGYRIDEYNEKGQLTKGTSYDPSGAVMYWNENTYDEKGYCTGAVVYRADGTVSNSLAHDYDTQGRLVRTTYYYAAGVIMETNDFDADGRLVQLQQYDENGQPTTWAQYSYHSNGVMASESYSDIDGNWQTVQYASDGKRTGATMYAPDGTVTGWTTYEYGADGNLSRATVYNADGSVRVDEQY